MTRGKGLATFVLYRNITSQNIPSKKSDVGLSIQLHNTHLYNPILIKIAQFGVS